MAISMRAVRIWHYGIIRNHDPELESERSWATMNYNLLRKLVDFRSRIAKALGVEADRKSNLYIELSRGATLYDLIYWLQILFSAGIATLGLVMNSPAVIIGAMLISPLMGPILAAGLSLASGDMILALRALAKIILSCLLAVLFAVFLVALLPFREMTNEIAARTQPNTLDLFIALLSGAVGSIAVCRDVKGVATSIPGVAIAVALMPPLCVAGYGLGLIMTLDTATGWRIASGGGLLFLTNLVAITFTAMVIFLIVQVSTSNVKERAEEWEHNDPESSMILRFIARFPALEKAREIRSLGVRFVMILIPLIAILIPLTQSFSQLQKEIALKRRDNVLRKDILDLWKQQLQTKSNGVVRSSVDQLTILETEEKLNIDLRVFDDKPYTPNEKAKFIQLLASQLKRPIESLNLNLTEIPTTSVLTRLRDRKPATPTLGELQAGLWRQIDRSMSDMQLPPDARLISRQVITDGTNSLHLKMTYLCETAIPPVPKPEVIDKVRADLGDQSATVSMERIPTNLGFIEFPAKSSSLPILGMLQLDFAGRVMRENATLIMTVAANRRKDETQKIATERNEAVAGYLEERWQVSRDRVSFQETEQPADKTKMEFRVSSRVDTAPAAGSESKNAP